MTEYRITAGQRWRQRWIMWGSVPVGYARPEGVDTVVRDGYAYQVGQPTGRLNVYDTEAELIGVADSPAHALLMFVRAQEQCNG